jgi:hypothetical protein
MSRRTLAVVAAAAALVTASAAIASGPTVRFSSPVTGMAVARSSLWVSVAGDGALLRLDPRTGRTVLRIDVHRSDPHAIGGGSLSAYGSELWVAAPVHVDDDPTIGNASGWIGRLDVRKPRLRVTQVYGDPPSRVAAGVGGIWVTGGHTIRTVAPESGTVVGTLKLPAYLGAVALGSNGAWVDEPNTGRLLEIDSKLRIRGWVEVGPSTSGSSLIVVNGIVWAATDRGLVGVSERTRSVVAVVPAPGARAVTTDGLLVWVAGRDALYSAIGQKATKRFVLSRNEGDLIIAAGKGLWIGDGSSNSLRRIRP